MLNKHGKYNYDAPFAAGVRQQAVGCVRFEMLNKHGKYNYDAPFATGHDISCEIVSRERK
jgi:hypothetical protein